MDDSQKRNPASSPPTHTPAGKFAPGNRANPGGRPKAFREYQEWLEKDALPDAKVALLACLKDPDGRVQMLAVKEVADRLFGKAPQAITNEDGTPVVPVQLAELLLRLVGGK